LDPFEAEVVPFLDRVCIMPFRVFCDPSSTARYVASFLFFFFDFLPLGFLKGTACKLLDEAPLSVSSPESVSNIKGSSFMSLEGPEVSATIVTT